MAAVDGKSTARRPLQLYFAPHIHCLSPMVAVVCLVFTALTDFSLLWPQKAARPRAVNTLFGYSLLLCAAATIAGSLLVFGSNGANGDEFRLLALGYTLFVASDTSILLQLAGYTFRFQERFILLSYFASQFCLYLNAISAASIKFL